MVHVWCSLGHSSWVSGLGAGVGTRVRKYSKKNFFGLKRKCLLVLLTDSEPKRMGKVKSKEARYLNKIIRFILRHSGL